MLRQTSWHRMRNKKRSRILSLLARVLRAIRILAPTSRSGILGKETRLLLRDRNFFVQTLVVPVLIIAFQAVVNPSLLTAGGNPRTAAVIAFGVAAYVLVFGREPESVEVDAAAKLIREHGLMVFCRALLNSNEMA